MRRRRRRRRPRGAARLGDRIHRDGGHVGLPRGRPGPRGAGRRLRLGSEFAGAVLHGIRCGWRVPRRSRITRRRTRRIPDALGLRHGRLGGRGMGPGPLAPRADPDLGARSGVGAVLPRVDVGPPGQRAKRDEHAGCLGANGETRPRDHRASLDRDHAGGCTAVPFRAPGSRPDGRGSGDRRNADVRGARRSPGRSVGGFHRERRRFSPVVSAVGFLRRESRARPRQGQESAARVRRIRRRGGSHRSSAGALHGGRSATVCRSRVRAEAGRSDGRCRDPAQRGGQPAPRESDGPGGAGRSTRTRELPPPVRGFPLQCRWDDEGVSG